MTLSATTPVIDYLGNGVTTVFAIPFQFAALADIKVSEIEDGDETLLSSGFVVAGTALPGGGYSSGTVTFTTAPAVGPTVRLKRQTPRTQPTDYITGDSFPAESHERALDRVTMLAQEIGAVADETSDRAVRKLLGETGDMTLPPIADRADRLMAFDSAGSPVAGALAALVASIAAGALPLELPGQTVVASVGAMKALLKANLADGVTLFVQGYSTAGDGGGGVFRWEEGSATAADGGTVFAADEGGTGRWKRVTIEAWLNIRWFGARGDDLADDEAAIALAMASANAAGGGAVYIPPDGTFLINDYVSLYSNVTLVGAGQRSRLHLVNSDRSDAIRATGVSGTPLVNIKLLDFAIEGDATFAAGTPSVVNGGGVNFVFTDDCQIRGLWVSGFSDGGIAVLNGNRNDISHNHVRYTGQGISVNASTETVRGNSVSGNRITDTGTYNGLHLEGGFGPGPETGEVRNTALTGNVIINSYEAGINIELAPFTSCTGNTVHNSGFGATAINMGIKLFGGFGSSIAANIVTDSNGDGIVIGANSGESTVEGNTTDGNARSCFVTDNATAASDDIAMGINSFTEGDIVISGNVSFRNRIRSLEFSNVAVDDPNTLDWFEEDEFTPTVRGSGTAGTFTMTAEVARFQRRGGWVEFGIKLAWSGQSVAAAGDLQVAGLPYPAANHMEQFIGIGVNGLPYAANTKLQASIPQGSSPAIINIQTYADATGVLAAVPVPGAGVAVAGLFLFGSYEVA